MEKDFWGAPGPHLRDDGERTRNDMAAHSPASLPCVHSLTARRCCSLAAAPCLSTASRQGMGMVAAQQEQQQEG
jgi:hypothetical protein